MGFLYIKLYIEGLLSKVYIHLPENMNNLMVCCVAMSTNLSKGSINIRALLCLTSFSVTEFLEFGTKLIMSYNKTYEDKHTLHMHIHKT